MTASSIWTVAGCLPPPAPQPTPPPDGPAAFVGAAACQACHANLMEDHARHGHANALMPIIGGPPATFADPPPGLDWSDVAYVIGGNVKAANFVDADGFLLVDGDTGLPVQFNLPHAPTQTTGHVPETGDTFTPQPFDFDCFRCHVTGAESIESSGGRRQDNRPGIGGTWHDAGVQCEACHGPGSLHIPTPQLGNLRVDGSAGACGECHASGLGLDALAVDRGLLAANQQSAELLAGPHATLACNVCHDPHVSVFADREAALRNQCSSCHAGQDMARHEGLVFVDGDYVERLSCESCHMPFGSASTSVIQRETASGAALRYGDGRSHVFAIDIAARSFDSKISPGGDRVVFDASGQFEMTLDVVCVRCHNGVSRAFELTLQSASTIAPSLHGSAGQSP